MNEDLKEDFILISTWDDNESNHVYVDKNLNFYKGPRYTSIQAKRFKEFLEITGS